MTSIKTKKLQGLKWFDLFKVSTMKTQLKTKKIDINHIKEGLLKQSYNNNECDS